MRTFSVGDGRVHTLAYTPDSRALVVDVRQGPQRHPVMGFSVWPVRELAWWDWATGTPLRRFRLRDSLFGPAGHWNTMSVAIGGRTPLPSTFRFAFTLFGSRRRGSGRTRKTACASSTWTAKR